MKNSMDLYEQLKTSNEALEFMVSRRLVEADLSPGARGISSGVECDDRPIPIQALGFSPFGNPNKITSCLHLHIDCQMRDDDSTWLFFPDSNQPDYSEFTLGCTIRTINEFSTRAVAPEQTCAFDENQRFAISGTEINNKADLPSSFIDTALRRLQFSLPQQVTDCLNEVTHESFGPPIPTFICPILVTNAPIYIADAERFPAASLGALGSASGIEDVAEKVPYVVVHRGIDRNFKRHCEEEFGSHLEFDREYLKQLAVTQKGIGGLYNGAPLDVVNQLIGAEKHILTNYFSQFVVCSYEYLPMLLDEIKSTVSMAVDGYESTEAA